jgi:hypothetical protein
MVMALALGIRTTKEKKRAFLAMREIGPSYETAAAMLVCILTILR